MHEDDYVKLKKSFNSPETNLVLAKSYNQTVILVHTTDFFPCFILRIYSPETI